MERTSGSKAADFERRRTDRCERNRGHPRCYNGPASHKHQYRPDRRMSLMRSGSRIYCSSNRRSRAASAEANRRIWFRWRTNDRNWAQVPKNSNASGPGIRVFRQASGVRRKNAKINTIKSGIHQPERGCEWRKLIAEGAGHSDLRRKGWPAAGKRIAARPAHVTRQDVQKISRSCSAA